MIQFISFMFQFKRKFSTSSQRYSTKFYDSAHEAVKDIPSDCKLLVGGMVILLKEHSSSRQVSEIFC